MAMLVGMYRRGAVDPYRPSSCSAGGGILHPLSLDAAIYRWDSGAGGAEGPVHIGAGSN